MTFTDQNFASICQDLANRDADLSRILDTHGLPPMWTRPATFSTLVHIILEQQVSLASAKAAFDKLGEKIGTITPEKVVDLTAEELRECYFSRQKTTYVHDLAAKILRGSLDLTSLQVLDNESVITQLSQVKGIGVWTSEVYLMMALQRADLFPLGDLALVKSLKKNKNLPTTATREDLSRIGEAWRPFRSVATFILWHDYLNG